MLLQGGQHGLPSVWLRLELCDDNQVLEEEEDDHNGHSNDHDYDNDQNNHHQLTSTLEDTSEDQLSKVFDQQNLEKLGECPSPRLLMITKLPDFYSTLSNKVGMIIVMIVIIIIIVIIMIMMTP